MKCMALKAPTKGTCEVVEVEVKDPGHGEIQVQGLACGICAWDVHVYKNGVDWPTGPGHEGVGRVSKVGPGVSWIKEGDWVTGVGYGFAEYFTVSAWSAHLIPPNPRKAQHWIVEPVSCVVTGIDHCNMKAGDRIAIVGCGFMGLMFVQALSRCLLDRLVVLDVDPARLEMARRFGAHEVMDARNAEIGYIQSLKLDTVVDCSGNEAGLELSSKIVKPGGRLNLFGWNHGSSKFPGDIWHMNGLTVINSAPGSAIRDPWPAAIRMIERGYIDLEPLVTHVVPLVEYPSLLKRVARREEPQYIKGVVTLAEM